MSQWVCVAEYEPGDHVDVYGPYGSCLEEATRYVAERTCTMDHEDGNPTWWSCNECDSDVYLPTRPKFCWNCGRKVVDE